jgi:hypothetical protein
VCRPTLAVAKCPRMLPIAKQPNKVETVCERRGQAEPWTDSMQPEYPIANYFPNSGPVFSRFCDLDTGLQIPSFKFLASPRTHQNSPLSPKSSPTPHRLCPLRPNNLATSPIPKSTRKKAPPESGGFDGLRYEVISRKLTDRNCWTAFRVKDQLKTPQMAE